MWKAVDYYSHQGFCSFNLGKTEQNHEGLRRFKIGWGAKEKTINYYKCFLQHKATTERSAAGWYTNIFSKMPIPILKFIGTISYRHIG
jgi:hypothetical protein